MGAEQWKNLLFFYFYINTSNVLAIIARLTHIG